MEQTLPTAILTRPAGRNTVVMKGLMRRGWSVEECPALEIREVLSEAVVVPRPEAFDLVVFVSRAAVSGYVSQLSKSQSVGWPPTTLTACMGPVTAAAIRKAFGESVSVVHPQADRAQDSEALWPLLTELKIPLRKVLIVRGQDGREWLSQRLQQRGFAVSLHQAYSRQIVLWPRAVGERFHALQHLGVLPTWLLTSPHGVDAIYNNLLQLDLVDWFARSCYVLTHERLRPQIENLLKQSIARTKIVIAGPDDTSILAGFEKIYSAENQPPDG